jgi:DnaJ-class molecular chaperone
MRHDCKHCKGTGQIENKRCWNCNGNGLDPAEYFTWSDIKKPEKASERSIIDLLYEKMVQHEERVRLRKEEEAKQ